MNWRAKKRNLHNKTRIEKAKGHVMEGKALTDDFWTNDILWQSNLFAYNISVMIRQKKNKFKQQEHCSFIDWFISESAKLTRSRHQTELKMYEHSFYKAGREEIDSLIEEA